MTYILIIAGEASGDLHGADFVREFLRQNPTGRFFGLGGDKMANAGVSLKYHVEDLAFLGFWEAIKNLRFINRVEKDILEQVDKLRPEMAVLIDYPGFNLRLAPKLKKRGLKVFYFISPQIWAWGRKRIKKIKKNVDLMVTIFEFEKHIYEKAGVPVRWVGHPLIDSLKITQDEHEFRGKVGLDQNDIIIGLFPGSREQEVKRILPQMIGALRLISGKHCNVKGVVGKAPALSETVYKEIIGRHGMDLPVLEGASYELMAYAKLNIVCSGTATLECAIIGVPLVIVYKMSLLTYIIARRLVKIPDIGLVNVVAGRRIVPELIQNDCTPEKIAEAGLKYLNDSQYYREVKAHLSKIKPQLGQPGAASKAARAAIEFLHSRNAPEIHTL